MSTLGAWATEFRKNIPLKLPIDKTFLLFCRGNGLPANGPRAMTGNLILRHVSDTSGNQACPGAAADPARDEA
jgi:hypothetical protein